MPKKVKTLEIPSIHESLKQRYDKGELTLRECAVELHKAGWHPVVDIEKTKKRLGID